jgi:hypothetical protein
MSRFTTVIAITVFTLLGTGTVASAAQWYNYWGSGTMTQNPLVVEGHSGWNYWTNNRVYRPYAHPFYLMYVGTNGVPHGSADNSTNNPFYFPAYGYNRIWCVWDIQYDYTPSISPVTCQGYR